MAAVSANRARAMRLAKNISQRRAAAALGVSQAHLSRLENDDVNEPQTLRRYAEWLEKQSAQRQAKRGRKASVNVKALRGERLFDDKTCARMLPDGWTLLYLTRTAHDTEWGAVYHPASDDFGMVGFVQTAGGPAPLPIIRFEERYDGPNNRAYKAIAAFCSDRLPKEIRKIYAPDEYEGKP